MSHALHCRCPSCVPSWNDFAERAADTRLAPDTRATTGQVFGDSDEQIAARADAENLRKQVESAARLAPPDEQIAAERDRLRRALSRLLSAYPRLASEHATEEQQRALRVARIALEETTP